MGQGGDVCSAINCSNNKKRSPELSFFRFPKDPERCKKWLINSRREDLMKKSVVYLYNNIKFCSLHFEDTQFMNENRNKLTWNAVPTLFDVPNKPASSLGSADAMGVIKTEPEDDPLALKSSDQEEQETSVECSDLISDVKREAEVEDSVELFPFVTVKCELKEETFDELQEQDESELEMLEQGSEVLTERCSKSLINSRREDLMNKNEVYLHKNMKFRSLHFENPQFVNQSTNKLTCNAVPTLLDVPNEPSKSLGPADVMGMIKTEPEDDPLALQSRDQEEQQTSVECSDPIGDVKREAEVEDAVEPFPFVTVKCEPEEETFDELQEKDETELEMLEQGSEVVTESTSVTDEHQTSPEKLAVPQNCVQAKNPLSEASFETKFYNELLTTNKNLQSEIHKRADRYSFKCKICGKMLQNRQRQQMHICAHGRKKKFKCNVCGKCFSKSGLLKIHSYTHTGEKPFKCDVCGICYSQSGHLKDHVIRTHTGEKPFTCDMCGKSFIRSCDLRMHKRIHTGEKPLRCDVCGKYFLQSGHLKSHSITHAREKPFKCDICGKRFACSRYLSTHLRKHTGENPFTCDVCGKCFSQSATLEGHKRLHSSNDAN
ncbi:zinc finger protein 679-like isoform X2 [Periplaneta americana]|uniref:zinc finger protein 679-like isoform X2 n=1 Tax=Periplaneta americana TaxID=6978 RepID=UPI0037E80357